MATFNERIQVIIDVVTDKATKGFKDFRTAVGEAEGFTGKLKAGVSSLGGIFGAAATGPAAMGAAVAAASKFAADAVTDYANLGVQVANFAAATGTTTEAASRLIEVTGDLGISTDSLQSTLGKLNKSIDPKLFDELGVSIARTSSGAVDVNGTFLNVIDRLRAIKDPTEQARVGAQLLGKGWQSVAPLIARSAKDIKDQLEGVSDVKVFTKEETDKAKNYKASLDDLKDKFAELALNIGEKLLPSVEKLADLLNKIPEFPTPQWLDDLNLLLDFPYSDLWNYFVDGTEKITYTGESITNLGDSAAGSARYLGLLATYEEEVALKAHNAAYELQAAKNRLRDFQDQIKGRSDLVTLVDDLETTKKKLQELNKAYDPKKDDAAQFWRNTAMATDDAIQRVSDFVSGIKGLPPDKAVELIASYDPMEPQKFLTNLQRAVAGAKVFVGVTPILSGNVKNLMEGGIPASNGSSIHNVNIHVNVAPGGDLVETGRVVTDAIRAHVRAGGKFLE